MACADSIPTGASPRPHCRFPGGVVSWEGHRANTRDGVARNLSTLDGFFKGGANGGRRHKKYAHTVSQIEFCGTLPTPGKDATIEDLKVAYRSIEASDAPEFLKDGVMMDLADRITEHGKPKKPAPQDTGELFIGARAETVAKSEGRVLDQDGPRTSSSIAPEIRDTDRRRLASRSRRPDRGPVLWSRRARLAISG
jgi:hypothetical protein